MTALLPVLLVIWIAVGYALFRRLPGAYAALAVVFVGQMFLPEVQALPGNPEAPPAHLFPLVKLTKSNVISYTLLFGSLAWDRRRWLTVTPQWYDLPILAWCICPFFSSLTNDELGWYDGCPAESLQQTIVWGVPYWLGRLYLGDRAGLRAWAAAVAVAGAVYAPLCIIELRLSPQLHRWVYGYYQHHVNQQQRGDVFRPMVFMEHGLAVSLFMAVATLSTYWLWRTGTFRRLVWHPRWPSIRLSYVAAGLAAITLLCRSTGALALGGAAFVGLELTRAIRTPFVLFLMATLPVTYIAARYAEMFTGQEVVAVVREVINEDRAASLDFRLKNEYALLEKAKERAAFGWGGHGRSRIRDEQGRDVSTTDSLWIIAVGSHGLVGLIALFTALLLPVARFTCMYPPWRWAGPPDAPAAAVVAALWMYACDHLVNAMMNPMFMLAAGGLAGATGLMARTSPWVGETTTYVVERPSEPLAVSGGEPLPALPERAGG